MSNNTKFCKAYAARALREFPNCDRLWQQESKVHPDEDILYVHDDFIVRSGIFPEDEVVFDDITEDWKQFCTQQLHFEVPAI